MSQKPWAPFYLETNKHTGVVSSHEDWVGVRTMHSTLDGGVSVLTRANDMPRAEDTYGMPKFDLKPFMFNDDVESARTPLYKWAEGQGMDLAA